MVTDVLPLLSYVLISTFTPGPSNISCASVGVRYGYWNTLSYQEGLASGVFLLMILSGAISGRLLSAFPALEPVLKYVGAAYILYLAFDMLKASYIFKEGDDRPLGFVHGLTLQVLNPKLFVYSLTLFSAFLAPIARNAFLLVLAAAILSGISFVATSTWAGFGTSIKTVLHDPRLKTVVNILLALSLMFTALALIGLL